jgi:transcriptional regulator with XRE-family HTH domain
MKGPDHMEQIETIDETGAAPIPGALGVLGERLRAIRRERGFSQDAVAKPEFTKSYVSAIERGKARPSLKALELMAARLGVTTSTLLALPSAPGAPDAAGQAAEIADLLDQARWAVAAGQARAALAQLDALEVAHGDALVSRPDLRGSLLVLQGRAHLALGAPDIAQDSFQQALLLLEDDPSGEEAEEVSLLIGESYARQGLFDLALPLLERAQAAVAAGTLANPTVPGRLAADLGKAYQALGHPEQARAVYEAALRATAEDNLAGQAARYDEVGRAAQAAGQWEQAGRIALGAAGIQAAEENLRLYTAVQQQLASLYAARGDAAGAGELLQKAQALLTQGGNRAALSAVHQQAATLALESNRIAEATRHAEEALRLASASDPAGGSEAGGPIRARAQQVAGRVAEAAGEPARADALFQQALTTAQAEGAGPLVREIAQTYAEILDARGDHAQAVPYYRLALASPRALP